MRNRTHLLGGIAVLAVAATVASPTGAWAEDNRGRGGRGGEVELRNHDDDPQKGYVNDNRGDDDATTPAAAKPAAAPASAAAVPPAAAPAATQAMSVVEGASVQGWTYAPPQLTACTTPG